MLVCFTQPSEVEGERRKTTFAGKAIAAGVGAIAILAVILVVRFGVPVKNTVISNFIATAPPGSYEEDFTSRDVNEQGRVCEILFAVLNPGHSESANTKYVQLPNGRLVSRIFEPNFGPSVSSFTATLTSTSTTSPGSQVIEDATVTYTQNPDTKTTTLDVEAPEGFSVVQVGAIITDSSDGLQADFLDPNPTDPNNFFYDYVGNENGPMLSLADVKSFVLGGSSDEDSRKCGTDNSNQVNPTDPRCGGPFYIYSYAKVCKDDSMAPTEALIDLVFTNTVSAPTKVAFEEARDSWNGIVKNTFPEAVLDVDQTTIRCNGRTLTFPAGTRTLGGLLVFAMVHSIDGEGGILAQAGPCAYSDGQYGFLLPRVGLMEFDIADVERLTEAGSLAAVVKHEMAHVLGVGVHWDDVGILKDKNTDDPRYTGKNGIEGYKSLDGSDEDDIAVANTGGQGTAGGHWREGVFGDELMTGYSSGANSLSIMTIRSLEDLGFVVDATKAAEYSLPGSRSFGSDDITADGTTEGGLKAGLQATMSVSNLEKLEAIPALQGDMISTDNIIKLDLAGQVEDDLIMEQALFGQAQVTQEHKPTPATPTKRPTVAPAVKDEDAQGGGRRLRKQKRVSSVVMQHSFETVEGSGVLPLGE